MDRRAVHVAIHGVVQGVGFRASTRRQAERLGVFGWVRNEPDGSVSAHAEGPPDAVDALVQWCHHGPRFAEVERVEVTDAPPTGATIFAVRR